MSTRNNFFEVVSYYFTINKSLSSLLLFTLVVLGLVAFYITPKQYNPEIVRPAFVVSLQYEGATIDQAVERVVYELVEKIGAVTGVDDIYTTVRDGAHISTTVIFDVGYDATKAKVDLITQLDQHSYRARGFIEAPAIKEINPETIPVLQIVFTDETISISELRSTVDLLRRDLIAVPGVSEVELFGGFEPAMVVALDPVRLEAAGVSIYQVESALRDSQQRLVTEGSQYNLFRQEMVVSSPFTSALTIEDVSLGQGLFLADVASVFEGTAGTRSYVFTSSKDEINKEVVMLSVAKLEGANAPSVTKEVRQVLKKVMAETGGGSLKYHIVLDEGELASREIYGLAGNLVTSILIVSIVLLLFLSARAALVVFVAIPLTFLIVFMLGFLFDQTINRITLFALILSLGLLVDSAIVVTESIYARLKQNPTVAKADTVKEIAYAVRLVGPGLLLSLATSVIVFLPMLFITGMMGPYMGPIAFFVPAALLVAFVIAIVFTPYIANRLQIEKDSSTNPVAKFVQLQLKNITSKYEVFLRTVLKDRKKQRKIIYGSLVAFLVTLLLPVLGLVYFQMLPGADREQVYVYLDLPVDYSSTVTVSVAERLQSILLQHDEVLDVQAFVGTAPIVDFNGMFKGSQNRTQPWQATFRVNLSNTAERSVSSGVITKSLRAIVADEYTEITPHLKFLEEPPGPPVAATFEARIYSEDRVLRDDFTEQLFEIVSSVQGVVDPYIEREELVGRVVYTPHQMLLHEHGIRQGDVIDMVSLTSAPKEVSEYIFSTASEYTPMLLTFDSVYQSEHILSVLSLPSIDNESIPLLSVINETYEQRQGKKTLDKGAVYTAITAETENRPIIYVMIDVLSKLRSGEIADFKVTHWNLFSMTLVNEDNETIKIEWGGEWQMTLENFRDLGLAMVIAFLLVYALLVGRYRNYSTPALILVTVPLGLIGILWGFFVLSILSSVYLTATALIGFIALIGIVVNNAIIFLEYVSYAITKGYSQVDALVEAGIQRLRPIVLTSLTTILGSLTIASDPVWSGLAWSIVFGLSVSTILTLIMYPILLVYVQGNIGSVNQEE